MRVNISKEIVNGDFVVNLTTSDITDPEKDLFAKWGVPKVNIGGTFPLTVTIDSVQHDATYSFPEEMRLINKFKLIRRFPAINEERELQEIQEAQADDYASQMDARIQDAITDLKSLPDNFTEDQSNEY